MQLIDKTEDIFSGNILKTGDFEMYKKVIGVNSSNLMPNMQGIVPLANTSSLEKENKEVDVHNDIVESVDLGSGALEENNMSNIDEMKFDIPSIEEAPLVSEPTVEQTNLPEEVPVSVGDISTLENIDLPKISSMDSLDELKDVDEEKKVIPNLELPDFTVGKVDMPVVPEASPEMFVENVVPTLNNNIEKVAQSQTVEKADDLNFASQSNIILDNNDKFKSIEDSKKEMLNKITKFISDEIDIYLSRNMNNAEGLSKLSNNDNISSLNEGRVSDTSSVVDSMINQIQVNPVSQDEKNGLTL